MSFKIYKGDNVVVEGSSPLAITGLAADTDFTEGTYQATRVVGDKESDRVDIPAFKTLPIRVDSVELTPNENNLETGSTRQLNIEVMPENATNKNASYASDNESVATVSNEGLVTAVSEGTVSITATVDEKTDTVTVSVTDPVEITTDEVTEEIDVVEYDTVKNDTEELPKGEEQVVQEGVNGYTKVTYKVTYENNVESKREEIGREVIDPIDEIINVGTFEEPED